MKANASFKPFKEQKEKPIVRNIRYICSPEKYDELVVVGKAHNVPLQRLIAQMVDFALENIAQPSAKQKKEN